MWLFLSLQLNFSYQPSWGKNESLNSLSRFSSASAAWGTNIFRAFICVCTRISYNNLTYEKMLIIFLILIVFLLFYLPRIQKYSYFLSFTFYFSIKLKNLGYNFFKDKVNYEVKIYFVKHSQRKYQLKQVFYDFFSIKLCLGVIIFTFHFLTNLIKIFSKNNFGDNIFKVWMFVIIQKIKHTIFECKPSFSFCYRHCR